MPNPRLKDDMKQQIEAEIKAGLSHSEIARKLHVSTGTVSNVRASIALDDTVAAIRAADQAKATAQERRVMVSRITALENELEAVRSLQGVLPNINSLSIDVSRPGKRHSAVPFLLASDWHSDEVVDGAAMNGLNEFNPRIAEKRVKTLFEAVLDILDIYKRNSEIDTMVMAMLGDFCSNWLHDELVETNALIPTEALLKVLDLVTGGIDSILKSKLVKQIMVVGAVGNHGRITKKPQSKNRALKNYEWVLYNLLARHYAARKDDRVSIKIPRGYFTYLRILGRDIRCHHGDAVKYQGGIGGVHIPLKKGISQWNKARHADLDIMGHWHQCEFSRDYVINGSLIGYSEYAEQIKAEPEPPQQAMFLLHNRYGATGFYPIKVAGC